MIPKDMTQVLLVIIVGTYELYKFNMCNNINTIVINLDHRQGRLHLQIPGLYYQKLLKVVSQ